MLENWQLMKNKLMHIWGNQLRVMYYEFLQPNENIIGPLNQNNWVEHSRKTLSTIYYCRPENTIPLLDKACPHVVNIEIYLGMLNWEVLAIVCLSHTYITCLSSSLYGLFE